MIEELDMSEEEAAACVFFFLAWRYTGVGPTMREKALRLLPDGDMEKVPAHIRENLAKRLHRSVCGAGYEWIDRAAPGYSATIEAMYGRKFGDVLGNSAPAIEVGFVEALRDEMRHPHPGRRVGGLLLQSGGGQQWLDEDMNPVVGPA
jgi:hypothetical protein